MSEEKTLEAVKEKAVEWVGATGDHKSKILHMWRQDETFLVVVLSPDGDLYFLRLFFMGDNLQLSQDNWVEQEVCSAMTNQN